MTPDQAVEIIKLLNSIQNGILVIVAVLSLIAGLIMFK